MTLVVAVAGEGQGCFLVWLVFRYFFVDLGLTTDEAL